MVDKAVRYSRRHFLRRSVLASSVTAAPFIARSQEQVHYAIIGCGQRGQVLAKEFAQVGDVTALCDVDSRCSAKLTSTFPNAKIYQDFRYVLESVETDAVIIATPDHWHGVAAVWAMQAGKDVYVEKGLANTIFECRGLRKTATKYLRMTQMGIQGHCEEGFRSVCELIGSGTIGQVHEVHAWTKKSNQPKRVSALGHSDPVPKEMDWNLWLGPARERPYVSNLYHPGNWRNWWDFGGGDLGEYGCHVLDGAFTALNLSECGRYTVECVSQSECSEDNPPTKSIIRYEFPARNQFAPVRILWYDGGNLPACPKEVGDIKMLPDSGSYFVGEKGVIVLGPYGNDPKVFPRGLVRSLPSQRSSTNFGKAIIADFDRSIRSRKPAAAHFDFSCKLSEMVLVGGIAQRVSGKLAWDALGGSFSEIRANAYINSMRPEPAYS